MNSNERAAAIAALIADDATMQRLRTTLSLARQSMPHENVAVRSTLLLALVAAVDDLFDSGMIGLCSDQTISTATLVRRVVRFEL